MPATPIHLIRFPLMALFFSVVIVTLSIIPCILIADEIDDALEMVKEGEFREVLKAKQTLIQAGQIAVDRLLVALLRPVQAMSVEEMQSRESYLDILLAIQPDALLPKLKDDFFDTNTHVWLRDAMRRLILTQDPDTITKELQSWFQSTTSISEFVMADGIALFDKCANESSDQFFLSWLSDSEVSREKLRMALRYVAQRKLKSASKQLIEMVSNDALMTDLTVLEDLTKCLGALRIREAVPLLDARIRTQKSGLFQAQYYQALGWIGTADAVDILLRDLNRFGGERKYSDCIPVVIALGDSGVERAALPVESYIRKSVLRTYVIIALGKLKVSSTATSIIEYIDDAELTALVVSALRSITGQHFSYTKGRDINKDQKAIQAWKDNLLKDQDH